MTRPPVARSSIYPLQAPMILTRIDLFRWEAKEAVCPGGWVVAYGRTRRRARRRLEISRGRRRRRTWPRFKNA